MTRWYKGVTLKRVGISWYANLWDGDRMVQQWLGTTWEAAKKWVNGTSEVGNG